jgi:hypothetical protein
MHLSDLAKELELDSTENFPTDSHKRVKIIEQELIGITPEYQKFLNDKKEP